MMQLKVEVDVTSPNTGTQWRWIVIQGGSRDSIYFTMWRSAWSQAYVPTAFPVGWNPPATVRRF